MHELTKILEEGLSLNDEESALYTALLETSGGNVTDIARKSGIKRTTAYNHLESLSQKGLLYKSVKGKRTLYFAVDPEELPKLLEERKRILSQAIPKLSEAYKKSFNRPQVRFYEGKEGIRNLYREILNTSQTIYTVFSPQSFFKVFTEEENHELLMILRNNGGQLRDLVEKGQYAKNILRHPQYQEFVKGKVLPEGFTFATDILATKEKTALISFDTLVGTLLEDPAIANLQRNLLKVLWKQT